MSANLIVIRAVTEYLDRLPSADQVLTPRGAATGAGS